MKILLEIIIAIVLISSFINAKSTIEVNENNWEDLLSKDEWMVEL
jgi:hypothetical protein